LRRRRKLVARRARTMRMPLSLRREALVALCVLVMVEKRERV